MQRITGTRPRRRLGREWQVLIVVSLAVFMSSLDLFIVNIALPAIRHGFAGSSVSSLSWVLNAYAIVFAALLVPAGALADRFGRRRAFIGGLIVFALGSLLCGAAPSAQTLVLARVIQAVGAAFLMPTSLGLLLPEFAPSRRPTAIGIWAAVGAVAAAAGPPLGGLLVAANWRLVFLVNLPVALGALIFGLRILRESRDPAARIPDLWAAAVLTVAIAALALGLVQAPDWGWANARTLACLLGAALGVAVFLRRCARHEAPVIDLSLLRVRSFAFANTAMLLFGAAFATMLLSNVLFLTGVWHESALRAGFSLTPGPVMAAVFAVPTGRLAARLGQRRVAGTGCLVFATGGLWWLWQVGATPHYATEMLPGMLLSGAGVGLTLASLSSAAMASLPPTRFATGSAILNMCRQIGSVLGVAVLVAIYDSAQGPGVLANFQTQRLFLLVAAVLAGACALSMGAVRSAPPAATDGASMISGAPTLQSAVAAK
ncbi:MAG: MFS transporter [Solirubrobacteraceae bacterium]|jgi:EmrB/QacA subfamily drug resistance transporter